jgi:hypothetical protein
MLRVKADKRDLSLVTCEATFLHLHSGFSDIRRKGISNLIDSLASWEICYVQLISISNEITHLWFNFGTSAMQHSYFYYFTNIYNCSFNFFSQATVLTYQVMGLSLLMFSVAAVYKSLSLFSVSPIRKQGPSLP